MWQDRTYFKRLSFQGKHLSLLGHIESACLQKRKGSQPLKTITKREIKMVNSIDTVPPLEQQVQIQEQNFFFGVDTGTAGNLCSHDFWVKLGKPSLKRPTCLNEVAKGQPLHTLGTFEAVTSLQGEDSKDDTLTSLTFTVTNSPRLNLLGWDTFVKLGVNVQALLDARVPLKGRQGDHRSVKPIFEKLRLDVALQRACQGLSEVSSNKC